MTVETRGAIPVTCVTGFLGAGKTTTILGLLKQLPKDYKVVLLKNEYGDVEVDSLLANQSQITGVSEILNGCLCCTMVGMVETAMLEIRDAYHPDRIIIESSGSAFPATLALQIRKIEPEGFKLDGVVTVIDCVNFRGYEDTSPSAKSAKAKLQAQYTDLLLLSKSELCTERDLDILSDHLGELNEDTPRIFVGAEKPLSPSLVFGLDSKLWDNVSGEQSAWKGEGGEGWHGDEVEVRTVWTGRPPRRKGKGKEHGHDGEGCTDPSHHHDHHPIEHEVPNGRPNRDEQEEEGGEVKPLDRGVLDAELGKLSFEIYRVKGLVRLSTPADPRGWTTYILNFAFGRYDLHPSPSLDTDPTLQGVGVRLTIMGERGEVARRARRFAEALGAECS